MALEALTELSGMSLTSACTQRNHPDVKLGKSANEETVNDIDSLQQFSSCTACNQKYETAALILPCSHAMCSHCVSAGESLIRRGSILPVCAVQCPCCRHPVELPCWSWATAASCLPKYLTRNSIIGKVGRTKVKASDPFQKVQGSTTCCDVDLTAQESSPVSSLLVPADGTIDLQEEQMEQSVCGLRFSLDPSNIPPSLHLSNSFLTVTYQAESLLISPKANWVDRSRVTFEPKVALDLPQVYADVVIAVGQYYWEVDVFNSSIYRVGVSSLDCSTGWWLERQGLSFCAVYDGFWEPLCMVPPQIKTIGVFLNIGGCVLSFHNPVTQEHLVTLPTRFSPAGVVPALGLGQGRLKLRCGLPPPPHVFLSKDSDYRRPRGARGGQWRKEIPFRSVKKVIQKFEELATSDSDFSLVSSFGSSCSILAPFPELGMSGGMFQSEQPKSGK
ncbi:uncharacterized protein LOC117508139 [Thalassophryne amazonica]|uniref:uncharacterized protein LOC117508139 n=1 Tax=Thalassophryne amazonica TaxID=390379 RepID=UPI00147163B3|nr:uncharacterized protein LOC117508139 [Thalassophryne amazonica]